MCFFRTDSNLPDESQFSEDVVDKEEVQDNARYKMFPLTISKFTPINDF